MTASRPALFPSAFYPHLGGVEELTRQLAREQTRRGKAPLVVANRWPRDLAALEIVDGLPVRRLPFRVPGPRPRQFGGWALRARATHVQTSAVLRDWQADLVHVQCVSSNAPFAGRASRQLDLPLVVTVQGELSMDANHTFQRSALARSLLNQALARAQVITGCSAYVIDEVDRFSAKRFTQKMRVIYNGIDVEECHAAVPERRDRPYLLGLGRLVPAKGYDVLVRAFARLAPRFPDHELLIAGDGPHAPELRTLIADLGLESRAHLLGTVDHRRALALMAGAHAFALCSHHEPQGIVVLEAMATGTPVVASAVGGVPEVVDGTNGMLFPAGDEEALGKCLDEILADDTMASGLRSAGRATASRFSWSILADQYQAAYDAAGA